MKNNYFYILIIFLSFFACDNNSQEITTEGKAFFHTTDPSRLFFKNTRGHKYSSITQKDSRMDYYYLKTIDKEQLIFPIIANNWLAEEAYVLLKENPQLSSQTLTLAFSKEEKKDTLSFLLKKRTEQYDFCKMLYTKSRSGYDIQMLSNATEWTPAFKNSTEKEHFQEVMRDYFRLTEQI